MKLGFVSAILADENLENVFKIAHDIGYDCVEVMCWPLGKADRRYSGISHIDITTLDANKIKKITTLSKDYDVSISALGYYPNPLTSDKNARHKHVQHIKSLITAATILDIPVVNTFVGRDHMKSVEDNWPMMIQIWQDIITHADQQNIKIGIENCPMLFTEDEWPGGKNLFTSPAIWRKVWEQLPSPNFGLNYDPSHMIIQHMNITYPIKTFASRLHHVHAKDARIDQQMLDEHGVFSYPNLWHTPMIPGSGDIDWSMLIQSLEDNGYKGAVCVEVEDRRYEGSLHQKIEALQLSHDHLRQFIPK